MDRNVPLWVFLLCALLGALFVVAFGWAVKSTLEGSHSSGLFGEAAVAVAGFPTLVKSVFTDVRIDTVDTDEPVRTPRSGVDLSGFTALKIRSGVDVNVDGLMVRADREALSKASGWRILTGAFTIDGAVKNAAFALSPDLEIVWYWVLTEDVLNGKQPRPPHRKFIHGFEILDDGSVIFSFDGGDSLQRFDRCSTRIWANEGDYHHAVTLDDSRTHVWTLLSKSLVKVATDSGNIDQQITTQDIIAANPDIDILQIRQDDQNDLGGNSRDTTEPWLGDPFHLNDVEPLPAAIADRFDGFEAGDLLVSARSLNLIFVVDPETRKVKWWRSGAVRRQHDPDWGRTGEITVFDNEMGRDYSRILSIDPWSYRTSVALDGRSNDFYSRIRGKHQFTGAGNLLVTSSQQGRVFEIDPDGNTVLEIVNTKPGSDDTNYVLSQATWLPADSLEFLKEDMSCAN